MNIGDGYNHRWGRWKKRRVLCDSSWPYSCQDSFLQGVIGPSAYCLVCISYSRVSVVCSSIHYAASVFFCQITKSSLLSLEGQHLYRSSRKPKGVIPLKGVKAERAGKVGSFLWPVSHSLPETVLARSDKDERLSRLFIVTHLRVRSVTCHT